MASYSKEDVNGPIICALHLHHAGYYSISPLAKKAFGHVCVLCGLAIILFVICPWYFA